ncbi:glutaminyl-peptide cyclotransferase [Rubrolithibacter danxiaensis]|uniref:glutaminyl-peptide cyclotransferase n=1 Tax=Rubrolithibacter danxiaensis TaxID=3390805 RepID=UPI003BF8F7C8
MIRRILLFISAAYFLIASCKSDKNSTQTFYIAPEAGTMIKSGEDVVVDLQFSPDLKVDSVVYLLDSAIVSRQTDTSSVKISTKGLPLGSHLIVSKIYSNGQADEQTSNIVLIAAKAPEQWSYKVVNTFPHDTASYTEGLEYHDGILYESDGQYGESSLRKVNLNTGSVIKQIQIPARYFAEGITMVGDKIIMVTYKEGIGFVYDKNTLEKLSEFNYQAGNEGWGLHFDGKHILNTDGSNRIYLLNKDTYQSEGYLEVYNNEGPVNSLNELEVIDGKIYANVYLSDVIVVINPETGAVEAEIDFSDLFPERPKDEDLVLNGIAWDAAKRRMFITGKKWPKLFEVKIEGGGKTAALKK